MFHIRKAEYNEQDEQKDLIPERKRNLIMLEETMFLKKGYRLD